MRPAKPLLGGGPGACRLGLPALILFVSAAPGGCTGCHMFDLDLSGLATIESLTDIYTAAQLNLLGRLVDGPAARKLHDFGRNEKTPSLRQTRELFDKAVDDAERELRKKWPRATPKLRMVSASFVLSLYDDGPAADAVSDHSRERLQKAALADEIADLKEQYPAQANDLPDAESLPKRDGSDDGSDDSPDDTIDLLGHLKFRFSNERPPGKFKDDEELERARLPTNPHTAKFRMVYELMADDADRRDSTGEQVLAVAVVKLSFAFHGEQWEQVPGKESGGGDATDAN